MPLNVYSKFDQKPSYRLGDRARTDGRTDARTDGQTDRRTDGRKGVSSIPPYPTVGGIIMIYFGLHLVKYPVP